MAAQFANHQGPGGLWIEALWRTGLIRPDVLVFPGFDRLERRGSGNDALACPPGRCAAAADFPSPVLNVTADELLARVRKLALAEPRTIELKTAPLDDVRADFQQASATLRFPDIVSVEVFALGSQQSTLAIWSRSVVGRKDFGVNRTRVERWLKALAPST